MTQTSTNLNLLYDSVEEPIAIDFSWAAKASPPQFEPSTLVAKLMPESGNKTSLRFNSTEYTLFSAQFIKASHTSWLTPGTPASQNKDDILLIFETNSDTQVYKYILFVVPILRTDKGPMPLFFQGLAGQGATLPTTATQSGYTLQGTLPADKNAQFAYYTTCINGYSESAEFKNAYVFVAVEGSPIDSGLMSTILTRFAEAASSFPANPEAPFMTRFSRTKTQVGTDFSNFVRSTRYLLDPEGRAAYQRTAVTPTQRVIREETLDPYKCVPFDPDTQVEDGKIKIDEETGIPISTLLEERTALRTETSATAPGAAPAGLTGGRLGKVFSNVLGYFIVGILGVVLVALLIFFVKSRRSAAVAPSPGTAAVAAALAATPGPLVAAAPRWDTVLSYALLFVFAGFLGFIIGALLT